jgi:zona occludens toxin (predicted ATPase)
MITLITGQPGAGKTLYGVTFIKALAEKENRQVYYSGIADLKLPWIQLDKPEDWHKVPPGSIVVIDECQRVFRPRGHGQQVPPHVAELETHRHHGLDLFLITQHPMLADTNVRRLVERHFHVKRKFGAPAATVHEFQQVQENADKTRVDSIRHEFIYPKSSFALYHSAEVHTHKTRIPMRVWVLLVLPLVFAGLVYATVQWFKGRMEPPGQDTPSREQSGVVAAAPSAPERVAAGPLSTLDYLNSFRGRVSSLPHTAPRYDGLTKPVSAPYPAACIESRTRCLCYTDQATPLSVPVDVCRQIVANGYYLDFAVHRTEPRQRSGAESARIIPQ